MEAKYLSKAIHFLAPNSEWKFNDDDLDTLEWFSDSTPPTKDAILKEAENQKQLELTKEITKENNRKSALAKLAALGLTEEEIASL